MSKADKTSSTPVTPPPPTIISLGHYLAATEPGYRSFDTISTGRPKSVKEDALLELLTKRESALHELIATLPAASLADAAVQIGVARTLSGILEACEWTTPEQQARMVEMHEAIYRITLSVLPVIAAAAELDLGAMCWDDVPQLRAFRFEGMECAA